MIRDQKPPTAAPQPSKRAPAALTRRLGTPLTVLGCLAVVTILAVGGTATGALAGLLLLLTIPVVGLTRNQVFLATRGRELPSTVEEVQAPKASEATAFAERVAARFHKASPHSRPQLTVNGPSWNGQNCTILLIDITGFGGQHRTDEDRRLIRMAMYDIVRAALKDSEVLWDACHQEDRGDGTLIVVPPTVATRAVADPVFERLYDGLRRHNKQSAPGRRIQLRVALHVGPVVSDPEGVTGEVIVHAARLVDAPMLKRGITETSAHLGIIVSTFVYDAVIKHENGSVEPASYRQVSFQGKESKITGWMHLAGQPTFPARQSWVTQWVSQLRRRQGSG